MNWFDYEMDGKISLSSIEEMYFDELTNFTNICEAINICNDSGVVTITLNENTIADKIKALIEKFKQWVKGIRIFLEEKYAELEKKIKVALARINKQEVIEKDFVVPNIKVTVMGKEETGDIKDVLNNINETIEEVDFSEDPKYAFQIEKLADDIVVEKGPMKGADFQKLCNKYIQELNRIHRLVIIKLNGAENGVIFNDTIKKMYDSMNSYGDSRIEEMRSNNVDNLKKQIALETKKIQALKTVDIIVQSAKLKIFNSYYKVDRDEE